MRYNITNCPDCKSDAFSNALQRSAIRHGTTGGHVSTFDIQHYPADFPGEEAGNRQCFLTGSFFFEVSGKGAGRRHLPSRCRVSSFTAFPSAAPRPSPIHPFTHSPIHPFTHSPIHPFTHSPIHLVTHSPCHLAPVAPWASRKASAVTLSPPADPPGNPRWRRDRRRAGCPSLG